MSDAVASVEGFKKGRVPREVRVRQLLDHAERLFLAEGFDGFSIEDLCRAAGVSRPVVYEHFGSKEGVYLACQQRVRDEFDEALRAALAGTEIDEIIREVADVYFGMLEADPRRWLFVFGSTSGFAGPMAETLYDMRLETIRGIAALAAALRPDLPEEQVTAVAHMVSGAGEELGRWWMRNRQVPRARIVDYYVAGTRLLARDLPRI
ncbi:MAG TPA: TetR/AcrR family transcriptional regulator [Nocardioides sp.]|nr:TetR/AcrR family transcriptional regulator [Nocardioides sp.]